MTHAQRNAAIRELISDYTRRTTRSPEAARAALIASGLYDTNGDLKAEFGSSDGERHSG